MEGVLYFFGIIMMVGNDENLEEIIDIICVFVECEVGYGYVGLYLEIMKNFKIFRIYLERFIIYFKIIF